MGRKLKANHLTRKALIITGLIAASAFVLVGCAGLPSSLKPQSDAATQIAALWWVMFVLGAIICVGVARRSAISRGDHVDSCGDNLHSRGFDFV